MEKERIYRKDFKTISTNDLNKAVVAMVETLNLSGGSIDDYQLYKLIQVYFQDEKKRGEINSILYS